MSRTLSTLLAIAAFAATSAGVRSLLPAAEQYEGAEKLAYLEENPGRYTALIIGSSGVYRGLDPRTLDPLVQSVEPDFRSFNIGARGLRSFEADRLLREAVEAAGESLRWVLIEPQSWSPLVSEVALETERTRDWHDWTQTNGALASSTTLRAPVKRRWHWFSYHLRQFCYRTSNYGELERLGQLAGRDLPEPYMTRAEIAAGSGYISIEDSLGKFWKRRNEKFLDELEEYETAVELLRTGAITRLGETALKLHRKQLAWLEARGLTVIYIMPPFKSNKSYVRGMKADGDTPNLLDFLRPDDYPELYAVEARLDADHLTAEAAQTFSRMCGEELAQLMAELAGAVQ